MTNGGPLARSSAATRRLCPWPAGLKSIGAMSGRITSLLRRRSRVEVLPRLGALDIPNRGERYRNVLYLQPWRGIRPRDANVGG
jgi:hypothetical protein